MRLLSSTTLRASQYRTRNRIVAIPTLANGRYDDTSDDSVRGCGGSTPKRVPQRYGHSPLTPIATGVRRYLHVLPTAFTTTTTTTILRWNNASRVLSETRRSPAAAFQSRHLTEITWLPEVLQNVSVWGGSGYLLKAIHADGVVPYWACFAAINVMVRIGLFPLVLYGAQTSTRFAKVVPEVQFLLSLFQADWQRLRQKNAPLRERLMLMRTNLGTLGGIYKLHGIHPMAVFLSPLLQVPLFWYVSVDLRKIVNGLDPVLAQQLVESSVAWVPDLTEADPWFGLPVLAGLVMYANVEVAIGRRSLSGPSVAKADTGVLLKDVFQSLAVFMPCFTSQMPAGVQIYLVTSFLFTMGQSAALRTEAFRAAVGLPSLATAPPPEAKYANQFIALKQLEQKAREIRGDGPVLGKGVLALDLECSFPGTNRSSTIVGSGTDPWQPGAALPSLTGPLSDRGRVELTPTNPAALLPPGTPLVHGVTAPVALLRERMAERERLAAVASAAPADADRQYMPRIDDEVMAKANRAEMPIATRIVERRNADVPPSFKRLRKGRTGKRKPSKG
jgi:membrane protein insertase Oxa1/YidC/SpoIIIJ